MNRILEEIDKENNFAILWEIEKVFQFNMKDLESC